jgi:hypothetical protein
VPASGCVGVLASRPSLPHGKGTNGPGTCSPSDEYDLRWRAAVSIAATLSRVTRVRTKTGPEASLAASAMSTRTEIGKPPLSNSRLTGVRQTPTNAAIVRTRAGGPVLPRGEAGATIGPSVRHHRGRHVTPVLE